MSAESPETSAVVPARRPQLTVIPHPGRRPDLATLHDVRREMGKVYREMRLGRMDSQDGSRLVFVLSQVGKLIEAADVQARVEALERAVMRRNL